MHTDAVLGDRQLAVLKALQEIGYRGAVIAGGAVRDLRFNKPFADIDVFINMEDIKFKRTEQHALEILLSEYPFFDKERDFVEAKSRHETRERHEDRLAQAVARITGVNSQPVRSPYEGEGITVSHEVYIAGDKYQLIVCGCGIDDAMKRYFDFGLNKIYHNGKKIVETEEFKQDAENHTLTVLKASHDKVNITRIKDKRFPHMKEKYPDFKLKII